MIITELTRKRPLGICRNKWEENIKIGIKQGVSMWAGFKWLRIWSLVGSCEYGNEN